MKRRILLGSLFAAAWAAAAFTDRAMWLPAAGCVAWMAFILCVNSGPGQRLKTKAAGGTGIKRKEPQLYDLIGPYRFSEEVKLCHARDIERRQNGRTA